MANGQLNILAIGRNPEILLVVERLINSHEGWNATIVASEEEAVKAFAKTAYSIVLVCAGVSGEEEEALRQQLQGLFPGVVVVRHFGGGSGLLENEILAILSAQKK